MRAKSRQMGRAQNGNFRNQGPTYPCRSRCPIYTSSTCSRLAYILRKLSYPYAVWLAPLDSTINRENTQEPTDLPTYPSLCEMGKTHVDTGRTCKLHRHHPRSGFYLDPCALRQWCISSSIVPVPNSSPKLQKPNPITSRHNIHILDSSSLSQF